MVGVHVADRCFEMGQAEGLIGAQGSLKFDQCIGMLAVLLKAKAAVECLFRFLKIPRLASIYPSLR